MANNEVAKVSAVKQLCNTVEKMGKSFEAALPPQVPSKKFIRIVQTAIQEPDLARKIEQGKVDKHSLFSSCQKAAQDGLVIDNREAALVTFWDKDSSSYKCQYMPMIAGILKKMNNSGEVSTVSAHVVYLKDYFKHTLGDRESIEHTYTDIDDKGNSIDRGVPVRAYAVAHMKDGSIQRCVMTKSQIEEVKGIAKTKTIWEGPFADQMWEKTVLRRLAKRLPSSSDLERLFEADNETYSMDPDRDSDWVEPETLGDPVAEPAPAQKKSTRAASVIKKKAGKEAPPKDIEDAEFTEEGPPPFDPEEEGFGQQESDVI